MHVLGVNAKIRSVDIDILTRNAIVEVGGVALPTRVAARVTLGLGYTVIAYSPGLNAEAITAVEVAGGIGTNDIATLLDVLAP